MNIQKPYTRLSITFVAALFLVALFSSEAPAQAESVLDPLTEMQAVQAELSMLDYALRNPKAKIDGRRLPPDTVLEMKKALVSYHSHLTEKFQDPTLDKAEADFDEHHWIHTFRQKDHQRSLDFSVQSGRPSEPIPLDEVARLFSVIFDQTALESDSHTHFDIPDRSFDFFVWQDEGLERKLEIEIKDSVVTVHFSDRSSLDPSGKSKFPGDRISLTAIASSRTESFTSESSSSR